MLLPVVALYNLLPMMGFLWVTFLFNVLAIGTSSPSESDPGFGLFCFDFRALAVTIRRKAKT